MSRYFSESEFKKCVPSCSERDMDGWQNLFVWVIITFLFGRQRKQILYNKSYKGEKFNLSILKLDYL